MDKECDCLVIGAGGSGLTAGMYLARADFDVIVVEKKASGGQIAITGLVENYPGFPEGISGGEIALLIEKQAVQNGVKIEFDRINAIEKNENDFMVKGNVNDFRARAVIIASGAKARKLGLESEEKFMGRGVSYCAVCDAPFFRNKTVAVIGGGNAAVQEALYLTKFADKVYLVHRRDELRADPILKKRIADEEKIEFVWNSVVAEIKGENIVDRLIVKNVKDNSLNGLEVNGVFVFIGHDPVSDFCGEEIKRDEKGYIVTDDNFETSLKGVFASGEVRKGAAWQLIAACGEGCKAALSAQHYLENIK